MGLEELSTSETDAMSRILGVVVICFILLEVALGAGASYPSTNKYGSINLSANVQTKTSAFDYVVTILMENKGFNNIFGNSSAPFLNQLAFNYSLATSYTAISHPSPPNYLALTSGSTLGIVTNCLPTTNPCNSGATCCPASAENIVDRLDLAGLTWRAYMEDYPVSCGSSCSPGNCFTGTSNYNYAVGHNPFVYYSDITSNSTRCARIVSANSVVSGAPERDDKLLDDLSSVSTVSNYMWLTPGNCDNMRFCSISTGDNYLRHLVPQILNSYIFTTQKALLIITFDEGSSETTNYPTDYLFTVFAGSVVKTGYRSSEQYSHYSLLKTVEISWGLQNLTSNDGRASSMAEFFAGNQSNGLQANFAYAPSNPQEAQMVSFNASLSGGTAPFSYLWKFNDGSAFVKGNPAAHFFSKRGNFTVTLIVTDASPKTVTVIHFVIVEAVPTMQGLKPLILYGIVGLLASIVGTGTAIGLTRRKASNRSKSLSLRWSLCTCQGDQEKSKTRVESTRSTFDQGKPL